MLAEAGVFASSQSTKITLPGDSNIRQREDNVSGEPLGAKIVDGSREDEDVPFLREAVPTPRLPSDTTKTTAADGNISNKLRDSDVFVGMNTSGQLNFASSADMDPKMDIHPTESQIPARGSVDSQHEVVNNMSKGKVESYPILSQRGQRILEGWTKLRCKRTDAQTLRVHAAELRARVDAKRKELSKADELFMHQARTFLDQNSAPRRQELEVAFRQLIEARVELSNEETELESVEGRLILAEGELREVESTMYQVPSVGSSEDDFDVIERERDPTESIGSSGNIRRDSSPQAQQYLSQLGEVTLQRERMMELESHYAQVKEEQAVREDIGLALDELSKLFLDRYEHEREELSSELQRAEKVLEEYKADLEDRDHHNYALDSFPASSTLADGSSRALVSSGEDGTLDDKPVEESNLEDPKLAGIASAFLLSEDDANPVYPREYFEASSEVVNKTEYINSWLLHRLRLSTKEIALLLTEHKNEGVFLDATNFPREVLFAWERDEVMPPRFAAPSRDASMAIHSGMTSMSRPRSEGHLRAVESNANANLLQRTRNAQPALTER